MKDIYCHVHGTHEHGNCIAKTNVPRCSASGTFIYF